MPVLRRESARDRGQSDVGPAVSKGGSSREQRLLTGWIANLFQMILGMTQQVVLIPIFLNFWGGEVLAAWLVLYAIGNLVLIADSGFQLRAINRFLAFRSSLDCDGRTAAYYGAMLRIYVGLVAVLVVIVLIGVQLVPPSAVLKFQDIPRFDAAFAVMAAGMLLMVPSNLVTALYRARGLYGRAVWLQCWITLAGQIGQLVAIALTGSLIAVSLVYVAAQLLFSVYLLAFDAFYLFPFLHQKTRQHSTRWTLGQFRRAAPFAVAGAAELALVNLPVVMVSALVSDRVAVAQWGLTRVVAGLLRTLCVQTTLPLAAELGHDYVAGAKESLQRLYARGSVFVTVLASIVVSGLLPFWPDFFTLWTRGTIPYDPSLTLTVLLGTCAAAPSILASGYASYSNRPDLLMRTKGLQLGVFLILSLILISSMGPLGAALAVVSSDLLTQSGLLGLVIIGQTLQRPLRHIGFLAAVMIIVTLAGWTLGTVIRLAMPWTGPARFFVECMIWLAVVGTVVSPLAIANVRARLVAAIPF